MLSSARELELEMHRLRMFSQFSAFGRESIHQDIQVSFFDTYIRFYAILDSVRLSLLKNDIFDPRPRQERFLKSKT